MEATMRKYRNIPGNSQGRTSTAKRQSGYALLCALSLCGLSLGLGVPTASAQELTHDEMVCRLDPQCAMPIVSRRLRGVTANTPPQTPGSFDRIVNFAFNSAELTPQARAELDQVAAVLKDPNVEKYPIVIHGHTDAVGTADYNQWLSERRAESARQYFIERHGIDPARLLAKGHGKSQPLTANALDDMNRRVQFENPSYATASAAARPVQPTPAPAPIQAAAPSKPRPVASTSTAGEGL
jgi:outer membrane protein OmpA-like peptidoglycan-associated protein